MYRSRTGLRRGLHKRVNIDTSDTTPPTIYDVVPGTPGTTSMQISWKLSEPGTGFIEYGTTIEYGSSTPFESSYLTAHTQTLSPLLPDTPYYYNIISSDSAGNPASYPGTFTTATGGTPITGDKFGIAYAAVNKNNLLVCPPGNKTGHGRAVAHRFKALFGGTPKYLRHQWKNRYPDYGFGDGGIYDVGVQAVDGNWMPTNTFLEKVEWEPGIGGSSDPGYCVRHTLPGVTTLVAGTEYAIVWHNTHPDAGYNYSSTNQPAAHGQMDFDPVHPLWPNREAHTLGYGPDNWSENIQGGREFFPAFDLEYTSGDHEGWAWVTGSDSPAYGSNRYGVLSTSSSCRFAFTYPTGQSTISVDAINLFLHKISGSTNVTVLIRKNSAEVATGTFTGSGVMASDDHLWQKAQLSSTVQIAVDDYIEAIFSLSAGTFYVPCILMRDSYCQTFPTTMQSYPFSLLDGVSQPFRSYDGSSATVPVWEPNWDVVSSYSCYYDIVS